MTRQTHGSSWHRNFDKLPWEDPSEHLRRSLRPYSTPRFSPDGERIAFTMGVSQNVDIWIYDLSKTTLTRLTTEGINVRPEWSPDGTRVLFRSERQNSIAIWWQPADGSGPAEPLLKPDVEPFEGILSPAYQSDESGQFEIYVRPFPNPGARIQVSTTGGTEPLWSRDGRTLFYRSARRIMAASVRTSPTFSLGARTAVLEGDFLPNASHQNYDVAPDGKHFLMIKRAGTEAQTIVVHNWMTEVRARVAAKR